jgi:hypothetical protein
VLDLDSIRISGVANDRCNVKRGYRKYTVYYDVTEEHQTVTVVAVGIKKGNCVFIGGEERQL